MKYPLAPNGIFRTIQGEGITLLGLPMVFIRLAGCSIGCRECDTDYSVAQRLSPEEIVQQVASLLLPTINWIWITGGEPLDHNLDPLLSSLRRIPLLKIALATSGHKKCNYQVDYLSVSPHSPNLVQREGDELKVVFGLNSLTPADVETETTNFTHYIVQPLFDSPQSLQDSIDWVSTHESWHLGIQAHKVWSLP